MFRFTVLVGLAGFALGELDFNCTSPSLGVSFAASLTKYTAAVQCGNLFLQGDTPQQPSVVLGEAADALYTLVMVRVWFHAFLCLRRSFDLLPLGLSSHADDRRPPLGLSSHADTDGRPSVSRRIPTTDCRSTPTQT